MHVLVTGAGGFLGRYIAEELLARGHRVRGLARGEYPEVQRQGVEMLRGDIRDAQAVSAAVEGVDGVIHAAAVAGIWGPRKTYFDINFHGAMHVLDACRQRGVDRLVYCSSPSVTFDGSDQSGVDESAPYPRRFLCHYPHSKAEAERRILAANSSELSTCALRPHLIWGPRDTHLVPRLLERGRTGQLRIVGAGANLVDMVYVENAAAAHVDALDALQNGVAGGRAYFISQGEPVNCWQWINQLLALGRVPPVQKSVSFRTAWRAGWLLEMIWRLTGRQDEPRMTRFPGRSTGQGSLFQPHRSSPRSSLSASRDDSPGDAATRPMARQPGTIPVKAKASGCCKPRLPRGARNWETVEQRRP